LYCNAALLVLHCSTSYKQIVCYNPKKKEGVAYKRSKDGSAKVLSMSAFNHPNVIYGDDSIMPSAVKEEYATRGLIIVRKPPADDEERMPLFRALGFHCRLSRSHTSRQYCPINLHCAGKDLKQLQQSNDTNQKSDIFIYDRVPGATEPRELV
jgi:hypothetical protein